MKAITVLLGASIFYGHSAVSSEDSIFGTWKMVGAKCEDNRTLSEEEKAKIQRAVSIEASRHFQTDGTLIDSLSLLPIPTETGVITCSFKHTISYTVSDQILSRLKETSIVEADCEGDNQEIESTLKDGFKKNVKIFRDQEFKLLGDKLFFYSSSPDEGIYGFNCDSTARLIIEFDRI
ncbi:MAG: hypothetical protein OXJ52_03875 [Oligoflexia bacterium]|nr:hypothetical protein [Oligoflexia bacterium]